MRLRHAAALVLVGWYLKSGRSGTLGGPAPPEVSAGGHAIITIPGKANTLTHAPLSQSENGTPRLRTRARALGQHPCSGPKRKGGV